MRPYIRSVEDDASEALGFIALSELKGIGPAFIKKIAVPGLFKLNDIFGEIKKITSLHKKKFSDEEISSSVDEAKKIIQICIDEKIKIIAFNHYLYPQRLKNIKDPPPFLYCKGNLDLLGSDIVGIIGTREPTATGIEISIRAGAFYSQSSWTICNGLAEGVDSYAVGIDEQVHGNVVGVLAGGLNFISEQTLSKKTAKNAQLVFQNNGLLISEINPGLRENVFSVIKSCRIQAGISAGLILIQSSMKGGSRFATRSFCETSRPLGVILPIPRDLNLPSYEANKRIIEEQKIGLSEFTGLKEDVLNSDYIVPIKTRNDFIHFSEKMKSIRSNQDSITSTLLHK